MGSVRRLDRAFFDRWYVLAIRARFTPMVEMVMMLKKRIKNILTYVKHRTNNAKCEARNPTIQWVKYMARGYHNLTNSITDIYFHCGDLSMHPLPA